MLWPYAQAVHDTAGKAGGPGLGVHSLTSFLRTTAAPPPSETVRGAGADGRTEVILGRLP